MKKTVSELWNDIFHDLNILDEINKNGYFIIKADMIKKYKEPRLMAKFDYFIQLPQIFKNNNLGLLPKTNGEYIIGKYNLFENIYNTKYEEIEPKKMELPEYIETIDPDNIYSESNALNAAFLSGMIKDFIGEDVVETIQGKMRASGFTFNINGVNGKVSLEIDRPAMEIDGGYEGINNVVLIEAKKYLHKDFIIRQLYFPYRHWFDKTMKPIIPVFLMYDNGIYTFFIYEFTDLYEYNSLELKDIKRYFISTNNADKIKIQLFKNAKPIDDLPQIDIPFPQADSFGRIIGLTELVESKINTAVAIAEEFEFEVRQGNYYLSAAKYLGLVDSADIPGEYKLTSIGFKVCASDMKTRNKVLIELILKHKVFYYTYEYYLNNKELLSKEKIIDLMRKYTDIKSDDTFDRRASTVRGWVEWIIGAQV